MRHMKKGFAILLCSVLLLAQTVGAFASVADTEALALGQELSYTIKGIWQNPPLMDAEQNALITSLLDALAVTGSFGMDAEGVSGYSTFDVRLQDQSVLPVQVISSEECVYIVSPFFGSPVAVRVDEIVPFYENIGMMLDTMMPAEEQGMYREMFKGIAEAVTGAVDAQTMHPAVTAAPVVDMEALLASMDIEALGEELAAWGEKAFAGEAYEGEIGSVLGVETQNAMLYQLTKDELAELVVLLLPTLKNEALWDAVIQLGLASMPEEEAQLGPDEIAEALDQIYAALDTLPAMAATLPDNLVARYNECYDKDGNIVLGEIEFIVPVDEENAFVVYAEWLPSAERIYAYAGMGGDGISLDLTIQCAEDSNLFACVLSVLEAEEVAAEVKVQFTSETSRRDGGETTHWELKAVAVQDTVEMGGSLGGAITQKTGEQFDTHSEITVSLITYGATVPVVTFVCDAQVTESQGLPFDPSDASLSFVYPGRMTEEEFMTWINEDVSVGVLGTIFGLAAVLPADVLAAMGMTPELPQGAGN